MSEVDVTTSEFKFLAHWAACLGLTFDVHGKIGGDQTPCVGFTKGDSYLLLSSELSPTKLKVPQTFTIPNDSTYGGSLAIIVTERLGYTRNKAIQDLYNWVTTITAHYGGNLNVISIPVSVSGGTKMFRLVVNKMVDPDREKGWYPKWDTRRIVDPAGKHTDCLTYVLDLNHDKFSIPALEAYARACDEEYPHLAADIRMRVATRMAQW